MAEREYVGPNGELCCEDNEPMTDGRMAGEVDA